MSQSIVQIVVALLVVGVVLYFAAPFLPAAIVQLIIAVAAVGCLIWLLRVAGMIGGGPVA